MREISLHLLDLVENALLADAQSISLRLTVDPPADRVVLSIADNGCGMTRDLLRKAADPFVSGRPGRRISLGLALTQAGAERAGGRLRICSREGAGTQVAALYRFSHPDRPPIGDFAGTVRLVMFCNPVRSFRVEGRMPGRRSVLDTRDLRRLMPALRLDEPDAAGWINERLQEMFPPELADL
ncbi:MAG: ATP-binding protein [Clostridia bacterium]|nr:ATP-binding protein [Clostridia bacterium]